MLYIRQVPEERLKTEATLEIFKPSWAKQFITWITEQLFVAKPIKWPCNEYIESRRTGFSTVHEMAQYFVSV